MASVSIEVLGPLEVMVDGTKATIWQVFETGPNNSRSNSTSTPRSTSVDRSDARPQPARPDARLVESRSCGPGTDNAPVAIAMDTPNTSDLG